MDHTTGRPNHIEDWLVQHKTGQWFHWTDTKNKVYANLITKDGSTKPSESEVNNGLKALQDAWDAKDYSRKRSKEYPQFREQFDLLYKDIAAGKVDATGEFAKTIKAVKDKHPKP